MTTCRRCGREKPAGNNCPCRKRKAYLPSQEKIRAECAKIQATWDEDTEVNRRCRQNGRPEYGEPVKIECEDRPS